MNTCLSSQTSSSICNRTEPFSRIYANREQLYHFWGHFNDRFEKASYPLQIRNLRVGGVCIQVECRSPLLLKYLDIQLAYCLSKPFEPDAIFRLWHDEGGSCLPSGFLSNKVIVMEDEFLTIKAEPDFHRMHAFNRETNIGYFCLQNDRESTVIAQGHLLYRLLYDLAKNTGRSMLHGAVIGYENKGVLICGNGGHGKSTLALSSLLEGCQYVGDDKAMFMKKEGETLSWPVYSIGSLYREILDRLPSLKIGNHWLKNDSSKNVFDISAYHSQFCGCLPIRALCFPKFLLGANQPTVIRVDSGQVLTHLIWSTITQVDDRKDAMNIRNMLELFKGLPCYEISLGNELQANAKFLKDHILSEL